jgi:hypothetical protein
LPWAREARSRVLVDEAALSAECGFAYADRPICPPLLEEGAEYEPQLSQTPLLS